MTIKVQFSATREWRNLAKRQYGSYLVAEISFWTMVGTDAKLKVKDYRSDRDYYKITERKNINEH